MAQNTSHAVMQQRHEAHDSLEEWRPIEGWAGYEVSNFGRVLSWKRRGKGRKWHVRRDLEPRILRADIRNEYPSVLLCDLTAGRKWASVHRLVLEAFVGPAPSGYHGAHGDGDKTNNRLGNLRWATPKDNNADKASHGTDQYGERIGSAKLTAEKAAEIKAAHMAGGRAIEIARRYGVCKNTVHNIASGRSWAKAIPPCRRQLQRADDA